MMKKRHHLLLLRKRRNDGEGALQQRKLHHLLLLRQKQDGAEGALQWRKTPKMMRQRLLLQPEVDGGKPEMLPLLLRRGENRIPSELPTMPRMHQHLATRPTALNRGLRATERRPRLRTSPRRKRPETR
jgi:hypothetical protein